MLIDTEHLHYWMCAIRDSDNPRQTLEAFWRGQIKSKEWLIEHLKLEIDQPVNIDIYAGWVGTLASMIFQSGMTVEKINNIDLDINCKSISEMMNKIEHIQGRFEFIHANMINVPSEADVVINTSCEHITQEDYELWLSGLRKDSLIVLQGNNYELPEHIRTSNSLQHFEEQSKLDVIWSGELETQMYTRYMIIGELPL
jgi:hypothetical protein